MKFEMKLNEKINSAIFFDLTTSLVIVFDFENFSIKFSEDEIIVIPN